MEILFKKEIRVLFNKWKYYLISDSKSTEKVVIKRFFKKWKYEVVVKEILFQKW